MIGLPLKAVSGKGQEVMAGAAAMVLWSQFLVEVLIGCASFLLGVSILSHFPLMS